jgi:tetratricopeptide (TPR) repeat protein
MVEKIKKENQHWFLTSICLAAVTAAIYFPVYKFEFIGFDDNVYVTQNTHLASGFVQCVKWAFTTNRAGNWHPLTWLSLSLDYHLFKNWAGGFHLVNVFFHILNTLLLLYLFWYMTRAYWPSVFIAAAFAIHPLHIESVAWVAERKDVLSTFFWLLTMIAYVHYTKKQKIEWYAAAIVFFTLGLLAKPMLVSLPIVLLLIDYWPLERKISWQLITEKIHFFVFAAVSSVITFLVQRNFGAMSSGESYSFILKLYNAFTSYVIYLFKMIWPVNLAVLYPHPGNDINKIEAIICGATLIAVTIIIVWILRKYKYLTVGWFWFVLTLVPVIGIVQVGGQAYADRYTYVPLIGIFMMIGFGAGRFLKNQKYVLILFLILVCWFSVSLKQIRYWKSDEQLCTHTLQVTKNNDVILGNYINYLIGQKRLDEAIVKTEDLLEFKPDSYQAHCNLSVILLQKHRIDEAEKHCKLALKYNPKLAEAYLNLAIVARERNDLNKAVEYYHDAIKIKRDYMDAYMCLGITLNDLNKTDEAIKVYEDGLKIEPENEKLQYGLYLSLKKNGAK